MTYRPLTESRRRALFVQCLPKVDDPKSSFQQHQLKLKDDIVQKLRRLGVEVEAIFSADPAPAVLVVFQSVGRIGDELPFALQGLSSTLKDSTVALAAIQDDERSRVGRDALPPHFQPQHLLSLCVVPGTSRLKDCAQNEQALREVARMVSVRRHSNEWSVVDVCPCIPCRSCSSCCPRDPPPGCRWLIVLALVVLLVLLLLLVFTYRM